MNSSRACTIAAALATIATLAVPATAQTFTSFAAGVGAKPTQIVNGPDGALWFTQVGANNIGRMTTAGTLSQFAITTPVSGPVDIVLGPDSALWFTESHGNMIGRMPTNGAVSEFAIPTANGGPNGITAGPDGALWFTEFQNAGNKIGRMTVAGVVTNEFPIPTANSGPISITTGPDGALWFTQRDGNKIARITTTGVITEFPVPTPGSWPWAIKAGPDGALWFTERISGKIGRITTAGVITEFTPPAPCFANELTAGPDGAMWFTCGFNRVGRITTGGVITLFTYSAVFTQLGGITAGSDGAMWFTDTTNNRIGRVTVPSNVTWTFEATRDFDAVAPNKSELLLRASNNTLAMSFMTGSANGITVNNTTTLTFNNAAVTAGPNLKLLATGNFDAGSKADLLWRDSSNGQLQLWLMNGAALANAVAVTLNGNAVTMPANWTLMASGDFNNNGSLELLWHEGNSGQLWLWSMNGGIIVSSVRVTSNNVAVDMPPDWVLLASGDFQRNGTTGLVWRNATSGDTWMWLMNGAAIATSTFLATMPPDWTLIGAGDLDNALGTDLLWRNASTNEVWAWFMNGATIANAALVATMPPQWRLQGIGDLDGDGKADLVWRNSFDGDTWTWKMNGAVIGPAVSLGVIQ